MILCKKLKTQKSKIKINNSVQLFMPIIQLFFYIKILKIIISFIRIPIFYLFYFTLTQLTILLKSLQNLQQIHFKIQYIELILKRTFYFKEHQHFAMNLDFILFTPPKAKYSFIDFWGQVIFIPKYKKILKSKQQQSSSLLGTFFNCYNSTKTTQAHLTVDTALMDVKGFYAHIQQSVTQELTQQGKQSKQQQQIDKYIPCLYLDSMVKSQYILIYFHSSGQDIRLCKNMLNHLRNSYQINVLAMEYPGYSIHKGKPNSETIKNETKVVYDYLVEKLGFKQKKIIVMGRSIGTGIALELMQNIQPRALVLISPFTNIKSLAKQVAGKIGHFLAKQTYDNVSNIQTVKCPTFILHGKKDELISYQNSIQLAKTCPSKVRTNFPSKMTHSAFDYYTDLTDPLRQFLMEEGINFYKQGMQGPQIPDQLFNCPKSLKI